jgi:predicted RNase H-like HicB family nuclease
MSQTQDMGGMSWSAPPLLPGTYSQGKTVALANIRVAIELTLEDMESCGETIPDPTEVLVGSVVITR